MKPETKNTLIIGSITLGVAAIGFATWYFWQKGANDKGCQDGFHKDANGNCMPNDVAPTNTATTPISATPPPPSNVFDSSTSKFSINDNVLINGTNVNVRSAPNTAATKIAQYNTGISGKIIAPATFSNGYIWYKVLFAQPAAIGFVYTTGYVAENYLKKA